MSHLFVVALKLRSQGRVGGRLAEWVGRGHTSQQHSPTRDPSAHCASERKNNNCYHNTQWQIQDFPEQEGGLFTSLTIFFQ